MAQQQGTATTTLIIAIVGWLCCQIISPYAIIRAKNELAEINAGVRPESDRTMTIISLVLGILGTIALVFLILWVVLFGGITVLTGVMGAAGG